MKLGVRIFLCYLAIFTVCFYYPIHWMVGSLEGRYRESAEEVMVDAATILAGQVATELAGGSFDPRALEEGFARARLQPVDARIYSLRKTLVDTDFYLTDARGRIIGDSRTPPEFGADYAGWRDVALTLSGAYGARTTRRDPLDPATSALYVGAPVTVNGRIVGCLTLIKPTASINDFLTQARPRVLRAGALSLGAAIVLSLIFSVWLTRPIQRLIAYADAIRAGNRPPFPALGRSEIAELGEALHKMQVSLEGKQYVEEYVQTLTHEIKSPLSAIRGAAELIDDAMPAPQRERFLENIRTESARIGRIVDTMLELAALENRRLQPEMHPLDLGALLAGVIESKAPLLARKGIEVQRPAPASLTVTGNPFLLHQAFANLLQNAIDFSPPGGRIELTTAVSGQTLVLTVADRGAGIPDYAVERVFDKFYSLQRPDSGRKSTGLGLNLVREVVAAHQGTVRLLNRDGGGAQAIVTLPLGQRAAASS